MPCSQHSPPTLPPLPARTHGQRPSAPRHSALVGSFLSFRELSRASQRPGRGLGREELQEAILVSGAQLRAPRWLPGASAPPLTSSQSTAWSSGGLAAGRQRWGRTSLSLQPGLGPGLGGGGGRSAERDAEAWERPWRLSQGSRGRLLAGKLGTGRPGQEDGRPGESRLCRALAVWLGG